MGENPQFSLNVSQGVGEIWVLLTRHITSIEDFRDNQEYITILVYKNEGKRVYYPCRFIIKTLNFNIIIMILLSLYHLTLYFIWPHPTLCVQYSIEHQKQPIIKCFKIFDIILSSLV